MAFPTTGILDDFNRANASDLGADWTPNPFNNSGDKSFSINSQQLISPHAEAFSAEWYHATTYGPDVEVYITALTRPSGSFSSVRLDARLAQPSASSGTADSYRLRVMAANTDGDWLLLRVDNTVETQLGSTVSQAWADGAAIGLEIIGSTLKGYLKPAAGSWTEVISNSGDTTYQLAGLLALHQNDNGPSAVLDDFGGGTVVGGGGGAGSVRKWRGGLMGAGRF